MLSLMWLWLLAEAPVRFASMIPPPRTVTVTGTLTDGGVLMTNAAGNGTITGGSLKTTGAGGDLTLVQNSTYQHADDRFEHCRQQRIGSYNRRSWQDRSQWAKLLYR